MQRTVSVAVLCALAAAARAQDFAREVAPVFAARCIGCHGPDKQRSGYRLDVGASALRSGELSAPNIVPGDSAGSPLVRYVTGADPDLRMPPEGEPLTAAEVAAIRRWIDAGAIWPAAANTPVADPRDWWSLRPLARPTPPATAGHAIDAFVRARLAREGLAMASAADDRTLLRRVTFDLIGLPPTPEEVDAYVADADPAKYEKLVDRLLGSPRHGERWARHWLDVAHYADTHGFDKDKPRAHSWPYRDYVVRAFNADKPYARFVAEQVAGDALFPDTRDGIEALGFLAAGPWDLIGHEEIPEDKIDGKVARHFDRDDMVGNALGAFASVTVQCAQCHDHKFDPVPQADYYALQAVFAAIDRTDVRYDADPAVAARRRELTSARARRQGEVDAIDTAFAAAAGEELVALDRELARAERPADAPEFGYHSALAAMAATTKWAQVDLGASVAFDAVALLPCHDDFAGIGAGFGFPAAFRVEASDDPSFAQGVATLATGTRALLGTPRTAPVRLPTPGARARFVRVTATALAERRGDYLFALAELQVVDNGGRNLAAGAPVDSADTIEQGDRWRRRNLTDGIAPALAAPPGHAQALRAQRLALRQRLEAPAAAVRRADALAELARIDAELAALPAQSRVYAGAVHTGSGAFVGTGGRGGAPRPIHVLARGQVTQPGKVAPPAALSLLDHCLPADLALPADASEADRRAALARWLADPRNPLTWRSIVNRVWHYHFGRGLVDTPNDFGRMGAQPSHPELLEWLAATFRDDLGGSLKALHRLIVTSAAYRQRADLANPDAEAKDRGNALLWRGHARKLEAEAVRDSLLAVSGALDLTMGGPGFRDFAIEQPEHSPHYRYDLADPDDPATFRRSIYRFVVRSQMQPMLTALDCADPSMRVDKRNQGLGPSQALALLNNGFALAQARRFAARVRAEAGDNVDAQIERAVRLALGRRPTAAEARELAALAQAHGLANACRVLFNLNEFHLVD
jgi:hypothetical protein